MARSAGRNEPPVLLVKWYDVTKWLLGRVDSFPKNQRFIIARGVYGHSGRCVKCVKPVELRRLGVGLTQSWADVEATEFHGRPVVALLHRRRYLLASFVESCMLGI